ncbi:hypothetical protein ACOIYM_000856 [Vibrio parahaemolyticus]
MDKKLVRGLLCLALLTGCQASQVVSVKPTLPPEQAIEKEPFVYSPSGREEFVFNELDAHGQKYGYDSFCREPSITSCLKRFEPYNKYVGMRGYFETLIPEAADSYNNEYWPVILENSERVYLTVNTEYGTRYGTSSEIIPYSTFQKLAAFRPEPLVPGSDIMVTSVKIELGLKHYTLSDGRVIIENNLNLVRDVSSQFKNSIDIANLLVDLRIVEDEIDKRIYITPKLSIFDPVDYGFYIAIEERDHWLRYKVEYRGEDWLFVNAFKVAADDYRWQSPIMKFERDNSSSRIWEWVDKSPSNKDIEVAKRLATADKAIIRFQGKQYYADTQLSEEQKASITKILHVYALL